MVKIDHHFGYALLQPASHAAYQETLARVDEGLTTAHWRG